MILTQKVSIIASSGQLLSFEYKHKSYDYVYNQRGDIVAITDEHQNVIAKYTYDEWGNILKSEGLTDIGKEVVKANPFPLRRKIRRPI
ncbi:hypothetical protein [Cytobacillus purgationiresistens]|uniref:YD repeat-containing protein n=1 Tax=Cytobacillus purgationiresistens TaxID=863449 RepID=A0ABU0AJW8_9BACI|nr:hypothetical protein [Cytobacillus purgationiresistens]MDQ0271335.1 YD repeat-containing protein [Cytobacillus purgationiresistens]